MLIYQFPAFPSRPPGSGLDPLPVHSCAAAATAMTPLTSTTPRGARADPGHRPVRPVTCRQPASMRPIPAATCWLTSSSGERVWRRATRAISPMWAWTPKPTPAPTLALTLKLTEDISTWPKARTQGTCTCNRHRFQKLSTSTDISVKYHTATSEHEFSRGQFTISSGQSHHCTDHRSLSKPEESGATPAHVTQPCRIARG